jgi:regulator of sigma E protease
VTTVLSFVIVIGILILVHELGHFFVARWTGVGVERFSIGFGPVLARWRGKETEYCLSAIPMGGYVKMVGEESPLEGGGTPAYDPQKAFALKPLWARFLIVFAGPGMNFVLAAVIFAAVLATLGRPVSPAIVGRVAEDGPAVATRLQPGDIVAAVDGRPVEFWEEVHRAIASSQGKPLRLTVVRDGNRRDVEITPRKTVVRDPIFKEQREEWDLGVGPQLTPQIGAVNAGSPAERAGLRSGDVVIGIAGQSVFTPDELTQAIQKRGGQTFEIVVQRDGKPVTLQVTATTVKEKSPTGEDIEIGRIGVGIVMKAVRYERYNPIAAEGERQRREGLPSLALFTAVISVNLAVLNLLPVPMLDGGHLLFFVIEGILGRPVSLKKREAAQQLGLVLLLLLMVFAIYNDLVRIDAFRIFR